jgi:hypothetical protein
MSLRIRGRSGGWGVGATTVAGLLLATVIACEPSAPAGFSGSAPPAGGTASGAPAASGPVPVAGKPTVTPDGGKVTVAGLGAGKSPVFDLPAGAALMTVTPCSSNQVNPFVTLYDAKDNKLGIIVDPTYKLTNLAGGSYYVDVAANPACVWSILIAPA